MFTKNVQHKKYYIKNVNLKTLNKYCSNANIFIFYGFCLAAVQIKIL